MARKQTDTKRARPSNTDSRIRWIIQVIMKFRGKWLNFPARNLALTFHSAWKRLLTLWKTLNVGWSVVYGFVCILTLCQHFIALVQVFCWRVRQAQTCWVFQLCRPPSPDLSRSRFLPFTAVVYFYVLLIEIRQTSKNEVPVVAVVSCLCFLANRCSLLDFIGFASSQATEMVFHWSFMIKPNRVYR